MVDTVRSSQNGTDDSELGISRSAVLRVVEGVVKATGTSKEDVRPLLQSIQSCSDGSTSGMCLRNWCTALLPTFAETDELSKQLASLALGVGFLREYSRQTCTNDLLTIDETDLALVWSLVRDALTSPLLQRPLCKVLRSAQGFLAVPLCSLIEGRNIDELFRLHVWLPDGRRGNPDLAIHSHQPFARSWVLAGDSREHSYEVQSGVSSVAATHAEYAVKWDDGKTLDKTYKTNQILSDLANTKTLACATLARSAHTGRNSTYSVPAAAFHRTDVPPSAFHATLFFFDSHQGFYENARVLGPKDAEHFSQHRDPAGAEAGPLAKMVDVVRSWELHLEQGQAHARRAEWEDALRSFNSALHTCESVKDFPNLAHYKGLALGALGNAKRRFGRYEEAATLLQLALDELGHSEQSAEFRGELGVVYRHMNSLKEAKHAFETQFGLAQDCNNESAMCRSIGNLGMVNYQLSQENDDATLLAQAIQQLTERVRIARNMKSNSSNQGTSKAAKDQLVEQATVWECIGLSRLSLCYTAGRNTEEAVKAASEALEVANCSKDSTVSALSRFFYGRALLSDGRHDQALAQFNIPQTCTPLMALCKEPSKEHLQYLRELVEAGVDLKLLDEYGYSALDYAVFSGDDATQELVLQALRQKISSEDVESELSELQALRQKISSEDVESKLSELQSSSILRKHYRELFQEKLRPLLMRTGEGQGLESLRTTYAEALATDNDKSSRLDTLRFIRYGDFLRFGKIARYSDGLAQPYASKHDSNYGQSESSEVIVFFSYRWINKKREADTPDDPDNTQYKRMVVASEEYLRIHPEVNREKFSLWVDYACVDQESPMPGVSALPMILAQCNALISLVDDAYYQRAWCSVEVMMVQALKKSYPLHEWYEHIEAPEHVPGEASSEHAPNAPSPPPGKSFEIDQRSTSDALDIGRTERKSSSLRPGPMDMNIIMAEKQLSHETDRAKVLFLERQSRLLS